LKGLGEFDVVGILNTDYGLESSIYLGGLYYDHSPRRDSFKKLFPHVEENPQTPL